jgi:hypothetical protein
MFFQRDKRQSVQPTVSELSAIDMQIAALSIAIEGSASPGIINSFTCKDAIRRINTISRRDPIRDAEIARDAQTPNGDYVQRSARLMRVYAFVATNERLKDCFGNAVRSLPGSITTNVAIAANASAQSASETHRFRATGSGALAAA